MSSTSKARSPVVSALRQERYRNTQNLARREGEIIAGQYFLQRGCEEARAGRCYSQAAERKAMLPFSFAHNYTPL
jgi:hypothetical protein